MNMSKAADEKRYRDEVREIVETVVKPRAEQIDREGAFPRENLQALAKHGWNGVLIPEKWGGLGLNHVAFSIAAAEIAKGCASTALVYVMHVGAAQTIHLYGNDDQKRRWLEPVQQGLIGTYSTSEKATGGHWWFNLSEAGRDGDEYILNAEKSFTTSAGQANFYVFQTRFPGARKPTDISFFIIDGKKPGIRPGHWDALGVRGNHSGPIRYENVRVHACDRLGEEGQGKEIVENGVSPVYLIGLGSAWVGVAEAALEEAVRYAKGTIHRDFNKRLADYQVIRQELANVKILLESLKHWQNHLARELDALQAEGRPQAELLIPLVEFKVHAAEVASRATQAAMNVSGGYGYKKGVIERLFRDARAGIVMGPSNHIAREWIGKSLLGLPLELWFEGGE
ncbi:MULTISPECIES: acyl-CoA dehydrogenase family protein [unclassified Thermoactinomyces]|jgi:alkylation response protein AidB-like acyl-CoA dehydrogenase|uniref:acyl-CoA dehydrogenase family protein n=1 Tax=unclassified Thermoactinomyces TaxID=2634588 RepID=UPI0007A01B60|nr:acyl-CoA dehydrogenase [Thermoactinomyces sp. AS95]MBI0386677.1 acyl-CoA/acyl-ACP dehydrogenase [Thermoactinomyces sp. CICC 24227]